MMDLFLTDVIVEFFERVVVSVDLAVEGGDFFYVSFFDQADGNVVFLLHSKHVGRLSAHFKDEPDLSVILFFPIKQASLRDDLLRPRTWP